MIMSRLLDKYGSWGIVAGAAEGLGKAFSKTLAKKGMHVILIDRKEEALYKTASEIEEIYHIRTKKLLLDLSETQHITSVFESMEGLDCRLLIYNAAYGPVRRFLDNSPEELDYHIELNNRMPVHLIYHFLTNVPDGKKAGVILMSSLAGLIGTNLVSIYGATKAFNWNLAESLHYELKVKGIDVMACCAGATDTPNYRDTQPEYGFPRPSVADPQKVADAALDMLGKKALFIPGFSNRITWFFLNRFLPRKWAGKLMNRTMFRMYDHKVS
jgi:short-subunit dehydrogenase